jgi:hypothetical protein
MIPSHVLAFLVVLYITTIAVNLTIQFIGRHHYSKSPERIWDIVWEYGPNLHKYEYVTNIIPLCLFAALFFINRGDSLLFEIAAKFILILVVRAFTTVSTIFPKEERCDDAITWYTPFIGGCYDKVFSAHTSIVTLITLIFWREKLIDSTAFWALNLAQMSAIVITHSHFTVDVILGFVITYLVYDGNYSILGRKF